MDAARWERVQAVFHGAVSLNGGALREYLERSCSGDADLLAEVEGLLAADASTSSLLDGGVIRMADRVVGRANLPSEHVGPYRVIGVLGEGGMGVVFRAEHTELRRTVALKVLRDGWLSPARRERFEAERRMLAHLNHPAIARLYDADVLPDGTPWFAMELVEGVPVTEWCARGHRTLEERVRILCEICEAVAFAQHHAIVHRDLKPSNLLVSTEGLPKLLDFGIAKHLQPTELDAGATGTGLRLMTPAYAAPEQLRGEQPGLHTDVWALGVVLFELLTGRRPFDASGRSPVEVEAAVLHDEPERPSVMARTTAGDFVVASRAEWQDLDVLCLTALQKDPRRRYPSAEALLRDLQRFREGRPLEARAESVRYRLAKFVRRHRWQVGTVTGAITALAVASLVFTVRLARARDAALAEASRAQHVQGYLQGLLEGGDNEAGPAADLRVLTLLERGAKEADTLASEPGTQADLFETLGVMYERLGQLDRADSLLQRALERHRALRGSSDSTIVADLVALGLLRLDQARVDDAERLVREALALGRRALPSNHPGIASALVALGRVLYERARYDEATGVLQEAISLRSRQGTSPLDLAAAQAQLADVRFAVGKAEEADTLNQRALAIYRQQLGERHPLVAERLWNIGWNAKTEPEMRQALQIFEGWYGHDHPRTASVLNDLAVVLIEHQRYDEADPLLRDALATQERLHGKMHPAVADSLHALASLAYFQQHFAESAELCRRAQDVYRTLNGEHHRLYAMGLQCEATALLRAGDAPARGEALIRQALDILRASLPAGHAELAGADGKLAFALYQQGRLAEAEPILRPLVEAAVAQNRPERPYETQWRQWLVAIYRGLGQPEMAARFEIVPDRAQTAPAQEGRTGAGAR